MSSNLVTASEADLVRLAAIVTAERDDPPAQGLPTSLLSDLMEVIPCDYVQFQGFDSTRQGDWFVQGFGDDDDGGPADDLDKAHCSTTGTARPAVTQTGPATCAAS
jgi:hypothetical protein